jgi:hypothetical protein
MKEKLKAFLKENKEITIAASCIVIGGAAIVAALASGTKGRIADQLTTYSKDGIIKFLQEMNPGTKLAIFKETLEDAYQIVML